MTIKDVIVWFAVLILLSALLLRVVWTAQRKKEISKKKRIQTLASLIMAIVVIYGLWSIASF
jgi:hypothetical protein